MERTTPLGKARKLRNEILKYWMDDSYTDTYEIPHVEVKKIGFVWEIVSNIVDGYPPKKRKG